MSNMINNHGQTNIKNKKVSNIIDNYIYLYHTKTLIILPTYPESITDQLTTTFSSVTPMSRSAPIYSFSNAGPRSLQVDLKLHRDMLNEVNLEACKYVVEDLEKEDYVDVLIKQLHAMALPKYAAKEKMVDPPIVAIRFGNDIFCKGVVDGGISVTYSGPILVGDKYACVDVSFLIKEIDPYDAESIMQLGAFRGLNITLERNLWRA